MSQKSGTYPVHAPMVVSARDEFQRGHPPPSYDECVKMNGSDRTTLQYMYSNSTPYQQQQAFLPTPMFDAAGSSQFSYGYANPYQMHLEKQQDFYSGSPSPQSRSTKPEENVLYLAPGAKVRTTASGAISIPPPPPGCAPSQGQMAAMSGQPVVIKKQKKSFF